MVVERMSKRQEVREKFFMKMAVEIAKDLSTCLSKQVGAVLVNEDNRILMTGYNGTVKGCQHCEDYFKPILVDGKLADRDMHHSWSLLNEIHAESNIIAYCAKNGISTKGTTLYITLSPCINCAKLIAQAGIANVYYKERYDLDDTGIKFLDKLKWVKCMQMK